MTYEFGEALPEPLVRAADPGTNVLVSGPAMSGKEALMREIIAEGGRQNEGSIVVTANDGAETVYDRYRDALTADAYLRIIDAVGNDEYENIPFTAEAVEAAFLDVIADGLSELKIECLADLNDLEVDVESEYRDAIYRLRVPDGVDVEHPPESSTIAHAVAEEENAVAVTFNGTHAEEYPFG